MCGIKKFNIRDFKYAELLEFSEKVISLIPEAYRQETPFVNFYNAYERFKGALNAPGKTAYRQAVADADANVCKASRAFRTMLAAGILHPDPRVGKVAEQIQQIVPQLVNPRRSDRKSLLEAAKVTLEGLRALPEELVQKFSPLQPYQENFKFHINKLLELHRQNVRNGLRTKLNNSYYRELSKAWQSLRQYINQKETQSHNPVLEKISHSINEVIEKKISG